jgi:hypothetical protein
VQEHRVDKLGGATPLLPARLPKGRRAGPEGEKIEGAREEEA